MADPYNERSVRVSSRMGDVLMDDHLRNQGTVNPAALVNKPLLMQLMRQMNRGDPFIPPAAVPTPPMIPEVPSRDNPMFRDFNGGKGMLRGGLEGILNALVPSAHANSPMDAQAPYMGVLGPMVGPQLPARPLGRYINGTLPPESVPDLIRRLNGEPPELTRVRTPNSGGVRG